jgi:hypothetical protein
MNRLEWTSSHQCTSSGWAHWSCFANEQKSHPPCPHGLFFFTSSLSQNFPPSYLPPTSPPYLPPTNPSPPHFIAKAPETSSGSELGAGAGVVGAGAWSYRNLELGGVGAGELRLKPERDPRGTQVSIFTFFLVCLFFFVMFLWSCIVA